MIDFDKSQTAVISAIVKGKVLESVTGSDSRYDEHLTFVFTDGTELRIRYDWIYEYELTGPK